MTIPKNTILKTTGLGDTLGDIVESFNLDLSSNYGAIRANRMKKVGVTGGTLGTPVAFQKYGLSYYTLCTDYVYKGGQRISETFNDNYNEDGILSSSNDMRVFNGALYVTVNDEIHKYDGSDWTSPITSGLSSGGHLFETYTDRLYVVDDETTVLSINTSDVITTLGAEFSIDLNLDDGWVITSLKAVGNSMYIGLLDTNTGLGKVIVWDGSSSIPNYEYNLESGVVAGTVSNNTFYILDIQGVLRKYAGNAFVEVDRFFRKDENLLFNAVNTNHNRFIHPNGMQVTDRGTILMLVSNQINYFEENIYENSIPSGIWEYDPNVGLYHKYSLSMSDVGETTYGDGGQQRISQVGALYTVKPTNPLTTENGTILCGATYFTDATNTASGIFCDDTINTTKQFGYFVTSKIFGNIQNQWKKVYALYKKFSDSTSRIIIKYRTEEDEPTEATITWTDIDRFTTTTDISDYIIGDEIQVLQGSGSGMTAHITSISEDGGTYTVILDENLPSSVIGLTGIIKLSKWIKAGTITSDDENQYKALTLTTKNTSPFIQFKVCLEFKNKDELYKLQIINSENIKE